MTGPSSTPEDPLAAATRRLEEIAAEIRDADGASPERVSALADEAARLASEIAAGIGAELRGDAGP